MGLGKDQLEESVSLIGLSIFSKKRRKELQRSIEALIRFVEGLIRLLTVENNVDFGVLVCCTCGIKNRHVFQLVSTEIVTMLFQATFPISVLKTSANLFKQSELRCIPG